MEHEKPIIAITIGDPSGIGPEIALKVLHYPHIYELCRPVFIGDVKVLETYRDILNLNLPFNIIQNVTQAAYVKGGADILHVDNIDMDHLNIGYGDAMTGLAMLEYTQLAVQLALENKVDAVVAGPHTKIAVEKAGIEFDGYPGLVANLTKTSMEDTFLMLVSDNLRVVNVTLHISMQEALQLIKKPLITKAIVAANKTTQLLGVPLPTIAVAGLNPHAGEQGMFGKEEIDEIEPAIKAAQNKGIHVVGPVGSDTLFAEFGKYDAYVAMYHDQAHIPIKLKAAKQITSLTIGTPILFASVGHGSAPDIAGKGIASPIGILESIQSLCSANLNKKC